MNSAAYLVCGELGLGPGGERRLGTGTGLGRGVAEISCCRLLDLDDAKKQADIIVPSGALGPGVLEAPQTS